MAGDWWAIQADQTTPDSLALLLQAIDGSNDPQIQIALMRGMLSGLAGRRNVKPPAKWATLRTKLSASKNATVRDLAQQLARIFGDEKATQQALLTVKDKTQKLSTRRSALRSLLMQRNMQASELLQSLLDEPALALDAIRGYATVENPAAPKILLDRYKQLPPELRRAVIETLAARRPYAKALLQALQRNVITRKDIPAHVARSLNDILGESFIKIYGSVRPIAVDRQKTLAKYKKLLTYDRVADASARRGRLVFKKTCASCHQLYGEGGKIGPNLTGSNRANLDYILLNSVDPSYDVPQSYKMVVVQTNDGRLLNGVIAEEDATRVVLKTVEQPRVIIAKEDIDRRRVSPKSMMPDGQLDKMKPQEVLDLIKYLRTTEQVELPK